MADTLGKRIAEHRKRMDITQDDLAEKMNVSSQAVSKWENDISCPDISLLPQLADYFGISVDELLRGKRELESVAYVPAERRKDISKMLFKVHVDSANGDIVNINLPLGFVKLALQTGISMPEISGNEALKNLKNIDIDALLTMAESGVIGKLIEVRSGNGDVVEIYIE